jgi:hypothetical protein
MKKSLLIFGMFTLMMVVTSFNTPNEIGGTQGAPRGNVPGIVENTFEIGGTQGAPRGNAPGIVGNTFDIGGTQGAPRG